MTTPRPLPLVMEQPRGRAKPPRHLADLSGDERRAKAEKMRAEADKKLLDLLTAEQPTSVKPHDRHASVIAHRRRQSTIGQHTSVWSSDR